LLINKPKRVKKMWIATAPTAVQDLQDIQDSVYPEDTKYVDDLVYRH